MNSIINSLTRTQTAFNHASPGESSVTIPSYRNTLIFLTIAFISAKNINFISKEAKTALKPITPYFSGIFQFTLAFLTAKKITALKIQPFTLESSLKNKNLDSAVSFTSPKETSIANDVDLSDTFIGEMLKGTDGPMTATVKNAASHNHIPHTPPLSPTPSIKRQLMPENLASEFFFSKIHFFFKEKGKSQELPPQPNRNRLLWLALTELFVLFKNPETDKPIEDYSFFLKNRIKALNIEVIDLDKETFDFITNNPKLMRTELIYNPEFKSLLDERWESDEVKQYTNIRLNESELSLLIEGIDSIFTNPDDATFINSLLNDLRI